MMKTIKNQNSNMKHAKIIYNIRTYIILCLIAVVMFGPFYWSVLTSLRPESDMFKTPPDFILKTFITEHYIKVFQMIPLVKYFTNTVFVTVMGMATNLVFCSIAGYAFAKIPFKGKKIIFRIMLASMMLPGVVLLVPQVILLKNFPLAGGNDIFGHGGGGFMNTFGAIILPGAIGVFGVFFMRQFFLTLPNDLGEAARVEGAGEFKIFSKIYFPLVKPALATLGIFTFNSGWNSFMWPNIVLPNAPDKMVLTMGLQRFASSVSSDYGPLMAGSVIISLPVILMFLFFQKYFIQGVALSGIKE